MAERIISAYLGWEGVFLAAVVAMVLRRLMLGWEEGALGDVFLAV
jgi:hypothetical protein